MTRNRKDWNPRLSIEIDPETFRKLQTLIPWGVKNQLFIIIIEDLIKALEDHGPMVIGAILSGKIKLVDMLKGGKGE